MTPLQFSQLRKFVDTHFGRIAYAEQGHGPAAVFIHGVPLNSYHWRGAFERLSDIRRCIAIDLLGLGHTEPVVGQDLSFRSQTEMIIAVLDQLGVSTFDLIGNDSGGAIAQLVAVRAPERLRSLVLTNCDVHDNWPPPAFMPAVMLARAGKLADAMCEMLSNLGLARSDLGLGTAYENPEHITPELLNTYLAPIAQNARRRTLLNQYVAAMECQQTVEIQAQLKLITAPTLIVWGTDDVFFPLKWAYWLKSQLSGPTTVVEAPGSRLFFCEERPGFFSNALRAHWQETKLSAIDRSTS
jgi:pimeloyl-ACP methyl ester carboxylesterase